MPSVVQTSAYVADVTTKYASGLQRFIRHNSVPEAGPAITWDHPETTSHLCDQCKSEWATLGEAKVNELRRDEAPLPFEIGRDKLKVPGVSDAG